MDSVTRALADFVVSAGDLIRCYDTPICARVLVVLPQSFARHWLLTVDGEPTLSMAAAINIVPVVLLSVWRSQYSMLLGR